MRFKFHFLLLTLTLFLFSTLFAQDKPGIKFGKVSPADFNIDKLTVDTTSGAIIIADIGISEFEGNTKGWFTLVFKHQRRIKIINKNGFDLANVEIPLYFDKDDEEKAEKINAVTYNLENGVVLETKLDAKSIFKDNYDKNHVVKKFTIPQVKEGSIIEYSYVINSDFLFNLHTWEFQGSYPRLWSEYITRIPEFFDYVFLSQGYHPFFKKSTSAANQNYFVTLQGEQAFERAEQIKLNGTETENHWIMKDVPALKEEKFTSSLSNHIAKIEFQLSGTKFPNMPYNKIMADWAKVGEMLMKSDDFGAKIYKNNNWLDNDMKSITMGSTNTIDKAKLIYYYINSHIKSSDKRGMMLTKSIKEVYNTKSGDVPEINLLLTAMLRHENMDAIPVILSTTNNGYTNTIYPLLERFNYVICKLTIDSVNYYLDASANQLGFGHLPDYCYNGHARTIESDPSPLYFLPDTLSEIKFTSIMLFNDKNKWSGNIKSTLGYNESCELRGKVAAEGKPEFEKNFSMPFTGDMAISNIKMDDLNNFEKPVVVNYDLSISNEDKTDIIYFHPMINEAYNNNYFKSEEREYPVEMPYKIDETVSLYIDIPEGYVVDEIPKSTKVILGDSDGYFEYLVSQNEGSINIRSKIKLEKATFYPEEYEGLRSFFDYIVKKHSEQIVFKVKK